MSDTQDSKKDYQPPVGQRREHQFGDGTYESLAEWMVLYKNDKPLSEMFYTSYFLKSDQKRPITFVFNGGPGAASAYLHLGALGPRRVAFNDDGTTPKPPMSLEDNKDSWLSFTDLVFIDPIGTGFSRMIDEDQINKGKEKDQRQKVDKNEYFKLNRDLESLGEFIQRFLSKHHRWDCPVYIAGESYGGFRVGAMAKRLQQEFGVGLNGAILISPVFEITHLNPNDYDIIGWLETFPTLALSAMWHGKSQKFDKGTSLNEVTQSAEVFAREKLARLLTLGSAISTDEKHSICEEMSQFIGLPVDRIERSHGRISFRRFSRELLKDSRQVIGWYDASIKAIDPFPDRLDFEGPDPTLYGIERVFASGINSHLRDFLGVETERIYKLLSYEVNTSWKVEEVHALARKVGVTDELRYGMTLNPHMKVFLTHGYHDLVTPYYASKRILEHMKLEPSLMDNVTVKNYCGGHMFYSWKESREQFTKDIGEFVAQSSQAL